MSPRRVPWLALLLAGACGGDSGVPTLDDFASQAAAAYCSWESRCCLISQLSAGAYGTEASCVPYVQLELQQRLALAGASIASRRATFDATAATTCVQQLKARSCELIVGGPIFDSGPVAGLDACRSLLIGNVPIGGTCNGQAECVAGARCVGLATGSPALDDLTSVVQPLTDMVGACVRYQEAGEICNAFEDCDPRRHLYCRGTDFTCQPLGQSGDLCSEPNAVGVGPGPPSPGLAACDQSASLFCDGSVCRHLPREGQACLTIPNEPQCDPDPTLMLSCVGAGFNGTGVCEPPAQLGDACGGSGIPPCAPDLSCVVDQTSLGHCALPPGLGETCDSQGRCQSPLGCDPATFVCEMPGTLPLGAACSNNGDCASLACTIVSAGEAFCTQSITNPGSSCSGTPTGFGGEGGGISTGGGGFAGGPGGSSGSAGAFGGGPGGSSATTGGGGSTMPPLPDCSHEGITADTISSFEDGSASVLPNEGRSGPWFAFDDGSSGCQSQSPAPGESFGATPLSPVRCNSLFGLEVGAAGCTGPGAGWGANFAPPVFPDGGGPISAPYDASAFSGVTFQGRAAPPADLVVVHVSFPNADTEASGDDFGMDVTLTSSWTFITVPFSSLLQRGTGKPFPGFDPAHVIGIRFGAPISSLPTSYFIDDVNFKQ